MLMRLLVSNLSCKTICLGYTRADQEVTSLTGFAVKSTFCCDAV